MMKSNEDTTFHLVSISHVYLLLLQIYCSNHVHSYLYNIRVTIDDWSILDSLQRQRLWPICLIACFDWINNPEPEFFSYY